MWTPWEMKQPSGLPAGAAADRGKLCTSEMGAGQSEPGVTQNLTHRQGWKQNSLLGLASRKQRLAPRKSLAVVGRSGLG